MTEKEVNTMEKLYEQPELEIIVFQVADIITDSLQDNELPPIPI